MVNVSVESDVDRLARLQLTIDTMRTELDVLGKAAKQRPQRMTWRQRSTLFAGLVLAVGLVTGVAGASAPGNPADVTYIPLSVPHKVLTTASIGKAGTNSPIVIGGNTTVPSDATSVELTVAVTSTVAGSLAVFPADNAASSTADTISFPGGNVVTTQVTKQSPGLTGKVSFKNTGTASASVTVTITGYSTQTTASDISGSGGSSGQVLTNTGSGASWAAAGGPAYAQTDSEGQTWLGDTSLAQPIISIVVPAGLYVISANASPYTLHGSTRTYCAILSPGNNVVETGYANSSLGIANISMSALLETEGGTIQFVCADLFASGVDFIVSPSLVAVQVTSASGTVATDVSHTAQVIPADLRSR